MNQQTLCWCLLCWAILAKQGAAHPNLLSANGDCTSHPTKRYGAHGSPTADSGVTFTLQANGVSSTSVCPGRSYTLRVSYPSSREGLLTVSQGTLGAGGSCPNRRSFTSQAQQHTATFSVPCGSSGTVLVRSTSAQSSSGTFRQADATLPIDTACTASCGGTATGASPSPSAVPSPGASPSPSPSAQGSDDDDDDDDKDDDKGVDGGQGSNSTSNSTASSGCTPSSIGYACSRTLGSGAVLHWTYGAAAAPDNACTRTTSANATAGAQQQQQMLHMALESPQRGYAALAFTQRSGRMYPADAIIATAEGVSTYRLTSYDVGSGDLADLAWVQNRGVVRTSAGTLMCFSVPTETTASSAGRRMLQTGAASTIDPQSMLVNWAVNDQDQFTTHTAEGGVALNAVSGTSTAADGGDKEAYILAHSVLMAVAWALLLPLGTLLPRHRWVLRGRKLGSKDAWFQLHMACQLLGLALFAAGFVIALLKLDVDSGDDDVKRVGSAHQITGIVVAAMAGLQLVAAFVRPHPGTPRRPAWNFFHHNWGRLTVVVAWVTVYLGIWLYHAKWDASLAVWLGPVVAAMGLILLTDLLLSLLSQKGCEDAVAPMTSGSSAGSTAIADKPTLVGDARA